MIIVDEREPVGELPPPFPPRNVVVKDDDDVRKFYDLKREIGRGRFGTVYLVNDKETGQKFAAKFVNTKRNQDRANVEREIEIMKALNSERPHPRLIQLYDAFDMDKEMCLVLEIVDGGELFERVIDDDFVLTERACTVFVRQICEGVEFIHSKNILHLDMKPENILCLSREGNRVKICDFGLARKYDPRKKLQVLFGTPEFVAPEVVNFEPISFGTDMWSVGVIAYVLLSGLSPFMGHNYVETMTNVTKNKYDFEDEAFKSVSEDAKDFIRKLLVLDKSLRLTPAQCQHHNWLKKPPTNILRRSIVAVDSESESESEEEEDEEADQEDMSIEEKIIKEEIENEKSKKKIDDEFDRQADARQRELEQVVEIRIKEKERIEEGKRREREERLDEGKRRERERLEEEKRREQDRLEEERRKEKVRLEKEVKEKERRDEQERQAEAKRKEKERQAEAKRREMEVLAKKEEELEITKKQLKEFVERWNSHPNSPYLIGTPISWDLQRLVGTKGLESRDSFMSVVVGPPSDPGDISEPDDDLDVIGQDDFIHYTIDPQRHYSKQLSPEEVAKELEEKLTVLQQEEMGKNKDKTSGLLKTEIQNKTNSTAIQDDFNLNCKNNKNQLITKKEQPETANASIVNSVGDVQKKSVESESKSTDLSKETKEEKMERHKKAYEERKIKLKGQDEDKKQKASSMESVKPEPNKVNSRSRDESQPTSETVQRKKPVKTDDKGLAEAADTTTETVKKINERARSGYKKEYEEYLKMVSESQKKLEEPLVKEETNKASPSTKKAGFQKPVETKAPIRKMGGLEKSASLCAVKELQKKGLDRADKSKLNINQKKPFSQRFRTSQEKNKEELKSIQTVEVSESQTKKSKEVEIEEHKKLYQEYLKMVGGGGENEVSIEINKSETEKKAGVPGNKPLDNRLMVGKDNSMTDVSRDLQRKVSESYKASEPQRKSSAKMIDTLSKEPLKRPEIIALQKEELGGITPRQRKISIPRYETTGENLIVDRSSRGSTPGSPVMEGSRSPKLERADAVDQNSRGSTPTKQLKKQPSRDVPLQAKDEASILSFSQRTSRNASGSYIACDKDEISEQRPSRELTPVNTPSLSRKTSQEDRSPSRGTREATPVNRRPSRDVPLTPNQLERLSSISSLVSDHGSEPQAWPDLIVVPHGEDAEECDSLDLLNVPVATLVKSPSGTISVPGVTVSQHDLDRANTPIQDGDELDPNYMSNNKMVAWILDIGNVQVPGKANNFTTSDRVSQWESRDSSPRPTGKSSRDSSPRPRDRSPLPSERHRDKSPTPHKQPALYPLSREPSTLSMKSSTSSENLYIQTPWGSLKRSPSRTNLSNSPSFEVPSITVKESKEGGQSTTEDLSMYSQSDDHMSVDSFTRSPSPKITNNDFYKQDTLEICEIKESRPCSRLSGELPPKPGKSRSPARSNREENLNHCKRSTQEESKSHTLPRSSRLMKMNSIDSMNTVKSLSNENKANSKKPPPTEDKKLNENSASDSLKRKSRFPPSPNQKKKLGPLLFSAQDRISQFEKTEPTPRTQRPITRTRSNMVFSKTTEKLHSSHNLLENNLLCDENKNAKSHLLSSKSNDKTHVKYLTNRLLDKVGKSPALPSSEVIQNVDSVNNNVRRNSAIIMRRGSSGMTKR